MTLVSIIIPTKNRKNLVVRAVRSALNQTHDDIKVIVVDDGSTDNTKEHLEQTIADDRLTVLRNPESKGASHARNKGFKHSSGDYVNFFDDDDELKPEKIEKQLAKFHEVEDDVGAVLCDVDIRLDDHQEIWENHYRGDIYDDLLNEYIIWGTHSFLFRREAAEDAEWDERLESNQEYDYSIQVAEDWAFDYVPEPLCVTHEGPGQISFDFERKINGTKSFFEKYNEVYWEQGLRSWVRNKLRKYYLLFRYRVGYYCGRSTYRLLP